MKENNFLQKGEWQSFKQYNMGYDNHENEKWQRENKENNIKSQCKKTCTLHKKKS